MRECLVTLLALEDSEIDDDFSDLSGEIHLNEVEWPEEETDAKEQ